MQRKANGSAKQPSALVRAACLDPGTGVRRFCIGISLNLGDRTHMHACLHDWVSYIKPWAAARQHAHLSLCVVLSTQLVDVQTLCCG